MKNTLILFTKELGIVSLCAILGVAALAVTYLIPNRYMQENVWASSIALYKEGLGAHVWQDIEETMLDNYIINNYGRYWHGYQTLLRPLLCFFTYSDIRHINMIVQLVLAFGFVCILAESKERVYVIPFFGLYIFLSPVSLFSSLQYSPCFYIMMLALFGLFLGRRRWTDTGRNYLFLLAGVLTAYFDFLTYPFITLGVPLIAYLAFEDRRLVTRQIDMRKNMLLYTFSWGIGYVGMWSAKWGSHPS